jgi:hypothetical protein
VQRGELRIVWSTGRRAECLRNATDSTSGRRCVAPLLLTDRAGEQRGEPRVKPAVGDEHTPCRRCVRDDRAMVRERDAADSESIVDAEEREPRRVGWNGMPDSHAPAIPENVEL